MIETKPRQIFLHTRPDIWSFIYHVFSLCRYFEISHKSQTVDQIQIRLHIKKGMEKCVLISEHYF